MISDVVEITVVDDYDDITDRPELIGHVAKKYPNAKLHLWGFESEVFEQSDGRDVRKAIFVSPTKLASKPLFKSQKWALKVGGKVADSDALARKEGKRVVRVGHNSVTVAELDWHTESIRDRFAELLKCDPWEVELKALWTFDPDIEAGRLDKIVVSRSPVSSIEQIKRETEWRTLTNAIPKLAGVSWRNRETEDGSMILWSIRDRTNEKRTLEQFDKDYPCAYAAVEESWKTYYVAWTDEGKPVPFNLFHLLIVGQSGAGKGSVIWSVIHGLLPAARKGLVEFYAIDPKSAEAPMAAGMFRQIATTPDEWDEMLEMLVADLKIRQHARFGVSRESKVSIDTPIRVLLIDELANLTVLDTDPARRKRVDLNLRIILTQGRSELNMVIAAVQSPQKEIIGQTRQGFPMRVALRTADAGETDMVLGAGATERGALAHLIPVANKGNGNVSAGVGYMVLEEPDSDEPSRPVKVRFPYTSDDDLMDWSAEFLALFPDNCKPASEEEQEAALEAMRASAPSKSSQKKDERIIFPKPDQSIYNLWDQRYVPPVVPVAVELSNPDLADQAADFQFGALDDDEEVAS